MTVTVQNVQYMHLIMYTANVIMDWYCSSCCYAVYTLWCLDSYQSECVRSSVVNGCLLCTMQCTTSVTEPYNLVEFDLEIRAFIIHHVRVY